MSCPLWVDSVAGFSPRVLKDSTALSFQVGAPAVFALHYPFLGGAIPPHGRILAKL